jgi:hypothetical protein
LKEIDRTQNPIGKSQIMNSPYLLEKTDFTREELQNFHVSELQKILNQLNLSSIGKKHELVERLYRFWRDLHSSSGDGAELRVPATSTLRCTFSDYPDPIQLRTKLLMYGPLSAFLLDPERNLCFVGFKSQRDAAAFCGVLSDFGFSDPHFMLDIDLERRSRELQLLGDGCQIHNAAQKTFRKTQTEPKLYWCPGPQAEEDE